MIAQRLKWYRGQNKVCRNSGFGFAVWSFGNWNVQKNGNCTELRLIARAHQRSVDGSLLFVIVPEDDMLLQTEYDEGRTSSDKRSMHFIYLKLYALWPHVQHIGWPFRAHQGTNYLYLQQ